MAATTDSPCPPIFVTQHLPLLVFLLKLLSRCGIVAFSGASFCRIGASPIYGNSLLWRDWDEWRGEAHGRVRWLATDDCAQAMITHIAFNAAGHESGNRNRGSGSLQEERATRMSAKYDSNMNRNYNSFIDSTPHMSLSITLSNVGHLSCHSLIVTSNIWQSRYCFTYTNPNMNTSMTKLSDL